MQYLYTLILRVLPNGTVSHNYVYTVVFSLQIPAVHQFGLFMGLIVMFCYIQVTLVMPSFLYLWYKYMSKVEYIYFLLCLGRKRVSDSESESSGEQDSTDSGIVLMSYLIEREQNFDSESEYRDTSDDEVDTLVPKATQNPVPNEAEAVSNNEVITVVTQPTIWGRIEAGMGRMTAGVQWIVVKYIAWPLVYVRIPLLCVFVLCLIASIAITTRLQPSDKAPQFLDSDSNIQKLLDLQSEVSQQQNDYDCWNCSGYFVLSSYSYPIVNPTQTTVTSLPSQTSTHSSSSSSSSSGSSTKSHSSSHQTSTVVKPSPTTTVGHTASTAKTTSAHSRPSSTSVVKPTATSHHTATHPTQPPTEPPTDHTHHTTATTNGQHKTTTPTATPPPQYCDYNKCTPAQKPAFGGGAIVYVVFGISGIERTYSPSHVIAEDNNLVRTHHVLM